MNLCVEHILDDVPIAEAQIDLDVEKSALTPEQRLIVEILSLAVDDLDVVLATRGTIQTLTDDERLHAASAAYFFLKGAAGSYMRLLGWGHALPAIQQKALAAIGALGGAWVHLASLQGGTLDRRIAGAMNASRSRIGLSRMAMSAKARAQMSERDVLSLI